MTAWITGPQRPKLLARRSWKTLFVAGSLGLLVSPKNAPAGDTEPVARRCTEKAMEAETRKRPAEAAAWYRAAAASYRYLVVPVRMAQIDYFIEKGIRPETDGSQKGSGLFREALAAEILKKGPVAVREETVRRFRKLAEKAERRASTLERDLEVRPPGLIPLEPEEPRRHVEDILEAVSSTGSYTLILIHANSDVERLPRGQGFQRAFRELRQRWDNDHKFTLLAEGAEYAARLARECGLAYLEVAGRSLRNSTNQEAHNEYREKTFLVKRRLAHHQKQAIRYYTAAAKSAEEEGDIIRTAIYRDRARKIQTASSRPQNSGQADTRDAD